MTGARSGLVTAAYRARLEPVADAAGFLPFLGGCDTIDADTLFRSHARAVHAIGRRYCRNASDADEVVQDTFLEVWRSRHQFSGSGPISAWIHAIATSKALMLRRREQVRATWPLFDGDAQALDEPLELRVDLSAALERLDGLSRRVTWLHDVEGWRHHEIGAAAGITVTCSKSRLRRARRTLRRYFLG